MNAIDQIREVLHMVASIFVWPVMLGLLLMVALTLMALGEYTREIWENWSGRHRTDAVKRLMERAVIDSSTSEPLDLRLEKILVAEEQPRWLTLQRLKMAVRIGPALGLMGTLIPMANALQGLADGDLPALASNMVTAFAATVIGLSVSVVSFLLSSSRESWTRSDSQTLVLYAEELLHLYGNPARVHAEVHAL